MSNQHRQDDQSGPSLAAELQEATSDLLDLTGPSYYQSSAAGPSHSDYNPEGYIYPQNNAAASSSNTQRQLVTPSPFQLSPTRPPSVPTYHPQSRLIRIDSSDGESEFPRASSSVSSKAKLRKSTSPSRSPTLHSKASGSKDRRPSKIAIQNPNSTDDDGEDDWLPSGGLYSTVRSVYEETAATPPPFIRELASAENGPTTAAASSASRPASVISRGKSPLKDAHGSLRDVWLNEFGERVINGQVVGQMTAGRRRADSPLKTSTRSSVLPSTPPPHPPRTGSATSSILRPHSPSRQATTPSFFLQSFPNAIPGRRQSIDLTDLNRKDLAGQATSTPREEDDSDSSNDGSDFASAASSSPAAPRRAAPPPLSPSLMQKGSPSMLVSPFRAMMRASSPFGAAQRAAAQLSPSKSKFLTLYSDGSEAGDAPTGLPKADSDNDDDVQDVVDDEPEEPPTARPEPIQRNNMGFGMLGTMSFAQRATALFSAPIVAEREEEGDEHDGHVSSDVEEEASRSVSLPVSPNLSWRAEAERQEPIAIPNAQEEAAHDSDRASVDSLPSSLQSLPASIRTISSLAPSAISDQSFSGSPSGGSRRRSSSRASLGGGGSEGVFAREVRIRGWSEVGEKARGWVVFHVRIVTKQGTIITAHRRFSSFVTLRRQLSLERPEYARALPSLPARKAGLFKYNARQLESRRKGLQAWLESVMLNPRWAECTCLQNWIVDIG